MYNACKYKKSSNVICYHILLSLRVKVKRVGSPSLLMIDEVTKAQYKYTFSCNILFNGLKCGQLVLWNAQNNDISVPLVLSTSKYRALNVHQVHVCTGLLELNF